MSGITRNRYSISRSNLRTKYALSAGVKSGVQRLEIWIHNSIVASFVYFFLSIFFPLIFNKNGSELYLKQPWIILSFYVLFNQLFFGQINVNSTRIYEEMPALLHVICVFITYLILWCLQMLSSTGSRCISFLHRILIR
jgi:hypothetical protein